MCIYIYTYIHRYTYKHTPMCHPKLVARAGSQDTASTLSLGSSAQTLAMARAKSNLQATALVETHDLRICNAGII